MNTVGQLIKEIRRIHELSQRDLADLVGVDASYVARLEMDRLKEPMSFLKQIRHLMSTSHVELAVELMIEARRIELLRELTPVKKEIAV